MTVVSIKEFEANIPKYLELAGKGEKVWIKLKNKIAYALIPASQEELDDEAWEAEEISLTPELEKRLDESMEQFKAGNYIVLTEEKQKELLGL